MEILQDGYLHAVVAAAGCTLADPKPDRGFDWHITHESDQHTLGPDATIKVQLKATQQIAPSPTGEHFSFRIKNEHLAKLAASPVTLTALLVVMIVPTEIEDWISSRPRALRVRHQAFWVNLKDHPVGPDGAKSTVHIPTKNRFDDVALCQIMAKVGSGVTV